MGHFYSDTMNQEHYIPVQKGSTWRFTTPTGKVDGIGSEASAVKLAAIAKSEDQLEAAIGNGPIAQVLKAYFDSLTQQPISVPDGWRPYACSSASKFPAPRPSLASAS